MSDNQVEFQVLWEQVKKLEKQNAKMQKTLDLLVPGSLDLIGALRRIAAEYPAAVGPLDCPGPPHACPKCEIWHILGEAGMLPQNKVSCESGE
jgi:hypothetical protein